MCIRITITRITLLRIITHNNYEQTALLPGGVHVRINKKESVVFRQIYKNERIPTAKILYVKYTTTSQTNVREVF
jgi:hypothetical protein